MLLVDDACYTVHNHQHMSTDMPIAVSLLNYKLNIYVKF